MIRINLLPYREKEKKKTFLRLIVLTSGSLVLFLLILVSTYLYFNLSIGDLEKQIREAEVKIVVLNKKVGDAEGFKRDKKMVEQKLAVIKTLESNRLAPVQMLDELYLLVPVKDLWLENLSQRGSDLRIEGMARNNDVVALFMKSLERASFIQTIDLLGTMEKEISGLKLQRFSLACVLQKRM
jgi:type IV pilus assembly protein PilN